MSNAEDSDYTTQRLAELWDLAKQDTYNEYTNYASYIGWYLALGYLESYEKGKARHILEEMKERYDSDTIIGEKIRAIINKL